MIAFLFGLIAHQEADGPWHWNYNVCNDPNYGGIGWGIECEAKVNKGYTNDTTREVQLDWILYHYDSPEHTVDFPFMSSVKSVILAASDVTGSPRPVCSPGIVFCGVGMQSTMGEFRLGTSLGTGNLRLGS